MTIAFLGIELERLHKVMDILMVRYEELQSDFDKLEIDYSSLETEN